MILQQYMYLCRTLCMVKCCTILKKKTFQHREGSAKGQRAGLYLCRACFYKFAQTGLIGATLVQF